MELGPSQIQIACINILIFSDRLFSGDYTDYDYYDVLAATQYIAPLMANFDTSQNDKAKIRYADNSKCSSPDLVIM